MYLAWAEPWKSCPPEFGRKEPEYQAHGNPRNWEIRLWSYVPPTKPSWLPKYIPDRLLRNLIVLPFKFQMCCLKGGRFCLEHRDQGSQPRAGREQDPRDMSPEAGMLLWGKAPGLEEGFAGGCWDIKEGKTPLSAEREGSRRGTNQFCPTSQTCTETLISYHLVRKLTSSLLFCVFSSKRQGYTSSGSKCTVAGTWSRLSTFRSLFGEAWGKMNGEV